MNITLEGETLACEGDFHDAIVAGLGLSPYYGANLSALSDVLSTDVERPLLLVWKNAEASRKSMGAAFDNIVKVLQRVEAEDVQVGYKDRFQFTLA